MVKNPSANAGDVRDRGLIPESRRSPSRRAWQPTAGFLPGESHEQGSFADPSTAKSTTSSGVADLDMTETTCYSLELCIQMGISFLFSFAFSFSSFHSYL